MTKPMTTKELVKQAQEIIKDHGQLYASEHEKWLVSTGIHPEYAEAIVALALANMKIKNLQELLNDGKESK
jgi:hypothetical protein